MREFMEMVMKMGAMSSAFVQYMLGLKGYGKSHKIYHYWISCWTLAVNASINALNP